MIPQRFVDKVRVIPCGGCWEWTARLNRDGYGEFWWDDRAQKAHRVAYELMVGPIPDGLTLDHLCRNRCCVNPNHLEPVSITVNIRRMRPDGETECPRGHPLTGDNVGTRTGRNGRPWRVCRRCDRERQMAKYHAMEVPDAD